MMNKKSLLPRLNAFGEYNLHDKKIAGFGANSYLAGISLSWNIFNGNETKNKITQSQINAVSYTHLDVYKRQAVHFNYKPTLFVNKFHV